MTTFSDIKEFYNDLTDEPEEIELMDYIDLNTISIEKPFTNPTIIYLPTGNTLNGMDFGHWVCVFRNDYGLSYFDSYGYEIDENLELSKNYFHKNGEHLYPHLSRIFLNEEGPISYNPHKFQDVKNSNHCGEWCALRIANKHLNHKEFKELLENLINKKNRIKNFKNYDDIIDGLK